ncbi:hypothetical protein CLV40_103348 [Actinokineospora auranticolor]|uniref:Flavodoxin-like protein n=1 Tax=Actinokineospora auranticolor TaxID=155976 RepID=A0A2S6GX12_9PSEU|nr:hypothetical protein CLV40_103348 [Actinokineospora auranticolor]
MLSAEDHGTVRLEVGHCVLDGGGLWSPPFFDAYYPCLDATRARPFGLYAHGNNDTAGAIRGIESITTGLGWEKVTPTSASRESPPKSTFWPAANSVPPSPPA